ncbi:MAG TPA: right-handed parallel beta-helix repeat-containing protein [Thermoanaerobaculia bacterium]|nr:right-handed parallel beta-helix repeat-containing protein [Thermoanaerobaculia bacterium]
MLRAPLFLSLFLAFSAFGDVSLALVPPGSMGDDLRAVWRVYVTNRGPEAVGDFPLKMWTSQSIVAMPVGICTPEGSPRVDALCTLDLPAGATRELAFTAQHDRRFGQFSGAVRGGPFGLPYENDEALFGPEYAVTSTADSGPGSLRQAIEDVNRECKDRETPCVIAFALDAPHPATIRLQTALPAISAPVVHVDGRLQATLDGSALPAGNGLQLEGGSVARVSGLAISGFPGNGIEVNGTRAVIRYNLLSGNGLRGVQVNRADAFIFDNVLVGNRRAGGFFWTEREVLARRNVVTGNGASGLFFHKPLISRIASYAEDNVIAFNAHAGIALSLTADGNFARNTFHDNAGLPIDVGLDGETRDPKPGLLTQGGRVGAPILTSARFDGTATIVTGRIANRPTASLIGEQVYVYAGQEVVAVVTGETRQQFADLTFTARIERDLRGLPVRAASFTYYVYNWDDFARGTSELSVPVVVE